MTRKNKTIFLGIRPKTKIKLTPWPMDRVVAIAGPTWGKESFEIHHRFVKLAQKKGRLKTDEEIANFLVMALAGEAGELANLFKKIWRGDTISIKEIRNELADVRIYLNLIAGHLGINLDAACADKLKVVKKRLARKEARK